MNNNLKCIIINLLVYLGALYLITLAWQLAELIVYGYVMHNVIDDYIAALLALSLTKNLRVVAR